MTALRAIRVEPNNLDQIERVRLIRNECKDGFSNYTDQITEAAHWAWWEETQPQAWLYANKISEIVGFGLLRRDAADRWVTVVAVLPDFAGQGYGKHITHDIVMRAPGRCYATARKDNPAAVALHVPDDWQRVDGPDERLVYFVTWPRSVASWPGQEAITQWSVSGWVAE